MFNLCVFLALAVAACYAAPDQTSLCRVIPNDLVRCLALPSFVSPEVQEKCKKLAECERLTCSFRESNLLDGEIINKERTAALFDDLVKVNPAWSPAVEHVKAACLGSVSLKPQGIYLDCPVYDVIHCVFTNLIKHASPSQWSTSPSCSHARAYAAACPVCDEQCFAPQVPVGSCNACLALPRSP